LSQPYRHPKWTDKFIESAGEEGRRLEEEQARRLDALRRDSAFVRETAKIQKDLVQLQKQKPETFRAFYKEFSHFHVYNPVRIKKMLDRAKDDDAKLILQNYVKYVSRFQVRLYRSNGSFQLVPLAPYKAKFHVRVTNGKLEAGSEAVRKEYDPVWDDLYAADELLIPDELDKLIKGGHAKVVQVDDHQGQSVLNQLESIAYRNDALTFILHHTKHQKYIFCLVGESVTTDETWRQAGKVITALQKQFYGRTKAGRPAHLSQKRKTGISSTAPTTEKPKTHEFEPERVDKQSEVQPATQLSNPVAVPATSTDGPNVGEVGKKA
jgi:hypothetical protein